MKPIICNYYLTYRCNARCGFCDIWEDNTVPASQEAGLDTIKANLADLKRAGVKFVDFTGGEPLMHPALPEALTYAKEIGLRTTVTSNGILYPRLAEKLAGNIDILQFSLGGADRDSHDSLRGVKCFDHINESVETARSLGEKPTFIFTVTDDNFERLDEVVAFSRSLNVLLFLNPCFSYPGIDGLSTDNAAKLAGLSRLKGVTIDRGFLKFIADGGNKRDDPRCLAVRSTIVISPDNSLVLPCFHFRESGLPIDGNLYEILHSPEVESMKGTEGTFYFCEGCTVYCYIRASLFRRPDRYFLPTVLSGLDYFWKLWRAR